jgi:hypothetical protein
MIEPCVSFGAEEGEAAGDGAAVMGREVSDLRRDVERALSCFVHTELFWFELEHYLSVVVIARLDRATQ